jgi:hypothetical protein
MVQNRGAEPGQPLREGTMGVLAGPPMTTTRITLVGRECVILLHWTNRATGGRDTLPGV